MKIISFDRIQELHISLQQCYEWVKEAILCKDRVCLPAKISLKPALPGVFHTTMPVMIPDLGWGGVKVVTRYPDRVPSLDSEILLYDLATGESLALMDGNWITAMRTGAVAAHSIQLFAKTDFTSIGIVGAGNTARAALKVLLSVCGQKRFVIKMKIYKNQHKEFAEEFQSFTNCKFEFYDNLEEMTADSDVLISAVTVAQQDMCRDECYKEGILLVPIHTRGFGNCDLFFDKIFVDDMDHIKGFRYFDRFKSVAEVADVVQKRTVGRESDKERIIAYNIGIALHDIYFAGKIYEMVKDRCPDVSLNAPRSKFWV